MSSGLLVMSMFPRTNARSGTQKGSGVSLSDIQKISKVFECVVFEPENTGKLLTLFPVESQEVLPNQEANEPIVTADATAGESSSASNKSNEDEVPIPRLPSAGMTLHDRRFLKTPKRLVEMMIIESDEPQNFAEAVTSDEAPR
jgi:hypothetical protein